MSKQGSPLYGKYRGNVNDNRDPDNLGRIRAKVPDALGEEESGWALPSVPYAGKNVGLFLVPPIGASVWIEFEHGDPEYPIWSGCFWAPGQVPASPALPEMKVLQTEVGAITLDDTKGSGGITIEMNDGKKVVLNAQQIEVTNGMWSIKLTSTSVSINDGALEVT